MVHAHLYVQTSTRSREPFWSVQQKTQNFSLVLMSWGALLAHAMPGQLRRGQTRGLHWCQRREEHFFVSLLFERTGWTLWQKKMFLSKKKELAITWHSAIFWLNFTRNLRQNWNTECHFRWKFSFHFCSWKLMIYRNTLPADQFVSSFLKFESLAWVQPNLTKIESSEIMKAAQISWLSSGEPSGGCAERVRPCEHLWEKRQQYEFTYYISKSSHKKQTL